MWWHAEDGADLSGHPVEPRHLFDARVAEFREWLRARRETTIAVVGHGTFFFHLAGRWLDNCETVELDLGAASAAA